MSTKLRSADCAIDRKCVLLVQMAQILLKDVVKWCIIMLSNGLDL